MTNRAFLASSRAKQALAGALVMTGRCPNDIIDNPGYCECKDKDKSEEICTKCFERWLDRECTNKTWILN